MEAWRSGGCWRTGPRERDPLDGWRPAYFTEVARIIETPWATAAIPDFVHPDTRGERPPTSRRRSGSGWPSSSWPPATRPFTGSRRRSQHLLKPRSVYQDPELVQRVTGRDIRTRVRRPAMSEITHRTSRRTASACTWPSRARARWSSCATAFPESWYSWRHQLAALAEAGFHAVAPDMRGYGQTDAPEDDRASTRCCTSSATWWAWSTRWARRPR